MAKSKKEEPKVKKPAAAPAAAGKTVAMRPKGEVSKVVHNYEEDEGKNNIGREDLTVPRLVVLQQLSPQLIKIKPEYIKDAEAGDICHTQTKEIWSGETGLNVIPISYRRTHIEWKPNRGGFVKDHGPDGNIMRSCTMDEKTKKQTLPNGNYVQVTAEYFVYVLQDDGSVIPAMIGMAGVQLKKSRKWNTAISMLQVPRRGKEGTFNPAMFFRSYHLTSVPNNNDQGDWFEWEMEGAKTVEELTNGGELYAMAKSFKESIAAGTVKVADPRADEFGGDGSGGAGAAPEDHSAM